jgi:hypothetical protein
MASAGVERADDALESRLLRIAEPRGGCLTVERLALPRRSLLLAPGRPHRGN